MLCERSGCTHTILMIPTADAQLHCFCPHTTKAHPNRRWAIIWSLEISSSLSDLQHWDEARAEFVFHAGCAPASKDKRQGVSFGRDASSKGTLCCKCHCPACISMYCADHSVFNTLSAMPVAMQKSLYGKPVAPHPAQTFQHTAACSSPDRPAVMLGRTPNPANRARVLMPSKGLQRVVGF